MLFHEASIDELQEKVDSQQFAEWMAFNHICPLPDPWRMLGILAATTQNYSGFAKKAAKPDDFIPAYRPRKQSAAEMNAIANAFLAAHNAQFKKK